MKRFQRLLRFSEKHIYNNFHISKGIYEVSDQCAIDLLIGAIKLESLIVVSISTFSVLPMYSLLVKKEYDLPVPIVLPFTEPETPRGFWMNMPHQMMYCVFGLLAIALIELVTCILKNTVAASSSIICQMFKDLDKNLHSPDKFEIEQIKMFYNNLKQVQDFDRFQLNLFFVCLIIITKIQ